MAQSDVHAVHGNRPLGDSDTPRPGPDGKFRKRDVDYGAAESDSEACAKCRFFQSGTCQLVRGTISESAWCDLWTPRAPQGTDASMKEDAASTNPDDRAGMDGDSDDDDSLAEVCPACKGTKKVAGKMCRACGGTGQMKAKKAEEINPKKLQPAKLSDEYLAKFYDLSNVKLLGGDAASNAVSWVPVFPEGTFYHPEYGELVFDEETIPIYIKNFDDRVRHIDIAVDVDHRNEEAVGWVKRLDWRRSDGLYALVEWNQLGQQKLGDKQYRYISAQFGDYKDEQTRETIDNVISALTITNFPFLKRMTAIQLSEQDQLRHTYGRVLKLHRRIHAGQSKVSPRLHKVIDLWLEGRTLKSLPSSEQRLSEGRAILVQARRFSASMGKQADDSDNGDDMTKGAKKVKKTDDDDADASYKKTKRAALLAQLAALDDDDASASALDDSDLDDDDLDDDDMKKSKRAYDQDDAYGAPANMDPQKGKSAQTKRSTGSAGTPPDQAGHASMSETVSLADFRTMQKQLHETRMQLREGVVDKQCRDLVSGSVAFGKEVIKGFREIALADKRAGDQTFNLLKKVQEQGELIVLGERGDAFQPDENAPDEIDMRRTDDGSIVVGMSLSRRAREYAAAHKLDYNDPEDRLLAMESVTTGGGEDNDKRPARAAGWR